MFAGKCFLYQHLQCFKSLAEKCTRLGGRPDHLPVCGYWRRNDRYSLGSFILTCFPGGSDSKESACHAGDPGLIPGQEDPLEKEMATHSRILAGKIPWTEEPDGL